MNISILDIALDQIGVKEIPGAADNPEVLKYFNETGFDGGKLKDETAWCAAFINWVLLKAGAVGTGKLNAKSFKTIGKETDEPIKGDIVVLWRVKPNDWRGHVGIFIKKDKDFVYLLGGNQNNEVCIAKYSINRVEAYRTLRNEL